ncbi:MAG: TnpV protein [Lachnospiraceae bacterium]|nr:TnpV protein [Lachnospiraceae bacterium]
MEKQIYDEQNGVWYELHGDYYLPYLTVLPEEQRPIGGGWGQRHLRYLRQHRKALYTELQITGKLHGYLADLNEQAENMFLELVKQMAARDGVTEQIKVQNHMLWVQRMNNIRNRAMELVNNDLIYA